MKIALVGVTGLVGNVMLKVLEERNFGYCELLPVASEKSVGKEIYFARKLYKIVSVEHAIKTAPQIAIFSAGSAVSLLYAPQFSAQGTSVIDNSSAWRGYAHIPLVVPEINAHAIKHSDKIIANPNCSTIQMVMVLAPLHKKYKIKRIVISTYQSVSGTGMKAVKQMEAERAGKKCEKIYPHQIDLNILPHGGTFEENRYTSEEMKLVFETRKILDDPSINITATVVRVPVTGGHSESVNVEFENEFDIADIYYLLEKQEGIKIVDNPKNNEYPMPLFAKDKDDVFVGRIRRDESQDKTLNMWIVSDNLRKGAATNAIQIAQYLIDNKFC